MPISTKLFNDQAVTRFNRLTSEIQNTQSKIATGKNVLRASDDPVTAANISFTRDQKVMLDRFNTNIDRARTRLTVTENVLADSANVLTRAYELALQGRNDALSPADRVAIAQEVAQLKETMVGLANSRDSYGNFLFSGFKVNQVPFRYDEAGKVQYHGDSGAHTVQISEDLRMRTGIEGADLFLRVDTKTGGQDVFAILETLESDLRAGYANAVAPLGTALTQDQLRLMWKAVPEPVLCFDGDLAGRKAAYRAIDTALALLQPGYSLKFAMLPDGSDPDDLITDGGRSAMEAVLGAAKPLAARAAIIE